RARACAFRRGAHEAPAGLLGDRAQRVEDRPSRLVDRHGGSVVGKTTRQPAAVRRGRSGDVRQEYESDGENDDQSGCAHVRSPFAREYGRARRLFHERQDRARVRTTSDRTNAIEARMADAQKLGGTRSMTTPTPVVHLARSAAASPSHPMNTIGSTTEPSSAAITARPTSAAARPARA